MEKKHWWQYLIPRAIALCACQALFSLAGIVLLPLCKDDSLLWTWAILAGLCLLAFLFAWWQWIFRPYRKMENEGKKFLDGYTPEGALTASIYHFSPVVEKLLLRLIELVSPSRMFDHNKRKAQYLALQNQINPHFLYNTLDSIRSEAMLAQLDNVADMTEALASFFRYTISKVENLVSVEEELQNCATYFKIQEYRFEDRLQMEVQCSPEEWEEIRRCRLPKLTLQPILENAIVHGTELKLGVGKLVIHLERTQKRLLIRVSDNGVGMDEKTLAQLNSRLGKNALGVQKEEQRKGGLALVNVDHRIRLLFGDEYGLHIFSAPGFGTDVEVTIPIVTSDHDVSNQEVLQ